MDNNTKSKFNAKEFNFREGTHLIKPHINFDRILHKTRTEFCPPTLEQLFFCFRASIQRSNIWHVSVVSRQTWLLEM